MWLYKTMDGDCALFSGCDRINCKFRTCINISSNEDIRFCCLVSKRICNRSVAASKFHLASL